MPVNLSKNRRKSIVIGRDFQYKISLNFVLVAALCSFCILYVLLIVQENNIDLFKEIMGEEANIFAATFFKNKIIVCLITIVFFLILSTILFIIGLHYSHRIIGPTSRLTSHMGTALKRNFLVPNLLLRKKDFLRHIAATYNQLLNSIRRRNNLYITHVSSIIVNLTEHEKTMKKFDPKFSLEKEITFIKEEIQKEPPKENKP